MPTGHLYVLFGEMSIKVLCPFLMGLFIFFVELYRCLDILELKHLHHTFLSHLSSKIPLPCQSFSCSLTFLPFHLYIFLKLSLLSGVVRLCLPWVCPTQQNKAEAILLVLECISLERGWGQSQSVLPCITGG